MSVQYGGTRLILIILLSISFRIINQKCTDYLYIKNYFHLFFANFYNAFGNHSIALKK